MAEKRSVNSRADTNGNLPGLDADSFRHHSRQELVQLAKNLSSGKYKENSEKREKILKMLVEQLASS